MTLFAFVLTLGLAAAPEPQVEPLLEYGFSGGGLRRAFLTIAPDGVWTTTKEAPGGQLAPDEIATLTAAIAKAELVSSRGPPCPGRPGRSYLRVARGDVSWSSGCGLVPHASVLALVELVESLTTRRPQPVLVKITRFHSGIPGTEETAALMRNGAWTTHRGRGTLDAATMATIIAAFDAALLEAPPIERADVCRGDFVHHVDVPGRGEVRFVWPCNRPTPTLQIALDAVYKGVGLKSPP